MNGKQQFTELPTLSLISAVIPGFAQSIRKLFRRFSLKPKKSR